MAQLKEAVESPLQMTERHVREGVQRIAKQKALIARLKQVGNAALVDAAVIFLAQIEDYQRLSAEHMDRERAKPPAQTGNYHGQPRSGKRLSPDIASY